MALACPVSYAAVDCRSDIPSKWISLPCRDRRASDIDIEPTVKGLLADPAKKRLQFCEPCMGYGDIQPACRSMRWNGRVVTVIQHLSVSSDGPGVLRHSLTGSAKPSLKPGGDEYSRALAVIPEYRLACAHQLIRWPAPFHASALPMRVSTIRICRLGAW